MSMICTLSKSLTSTLALALRQVTSLKAAVALLWAFSDAECWEMLKALVGIWALRTPEGARV